MLLFRNTVAFAAGAALVTLTPPTGGGLPTSVGSQQDRTSVEVRADLELLRGQIAALEGQLADMQERRESLVDEFEAADIELVLSRRRLELIRLRLSVLTEESASREAEVERLSVELEAAREELAVRVVALYRMGPLSYSRLLLAADTAEEILSSYQLVGRLAAQDRSLVATVRRRIGEHQQAVAMMRSSAERLEQARVEEIDAVESLARHQLVRQELIRQIDVEAAAGRLALREQEDSAAALEQLLSEMTVSIVRPTTDGVVAATPPAFASARGSLPWPGDGPVTTTFGRHRHEVYETYTVSKGIEIGARAGSAVQAVYQGRVVYADWFQNYGLVVIVGHGDPFFTIYGHLAALRVRTGEWVDAGTEIGTVGETGSLKGPSLYFEVREGQEAINPESWLRRR